MTWGPSSFDILGFMLLDKSAGPIHHNFRGATQENVIKIKLGKPKEQF